MVLVAAESTETYCLRFPMLRRYIFDMFFPSLYFISIISGCGATSEGLYNAEENALRVDLATPEIRCSITPTNDGTSRISYEIRNPSSEVIHVIDNNEPPYQLLRDPNTLIVLYGLHSYDPRVLPHIIEMPVTRPLRSGERLKGEIAWPMRVMRDYYGGHGTPPSLLHGTIKVRCEVGWWASAITEADRVRLRFRNVLASQRVVGYGPLEITLP
jgi:hypothetical protein